MLIFAAYSNQATYAASENSEGEEISVGSLFFPILAEIERWPVPGKNTVDYLEALDEIRMKVGHLPPTENPSLNPLWISRNCVVFSKKQYVYGQNEGQVATYTNGSLAYFNDEPMQVRTMADMDTVWLNEGAQSLLGKPVAPGVTTQCLIAYAMFVGEASRSLVKGASVRVDKFSGNRVFYVQNLQEKARNAIFKAFSSKYNQCIKENDKFIKNKYCIIPTPTAVMQRQGRVTCGEYEFDQYQNIFYRNGVRYLSDDTVLGKKVSFAEAGT